MYGMNIVEKITIKASAEDEKSTVKGAAKVKLKEVVEKEDDDLFKGKSSIKTDEIELSEDDYPFWGDLWT